MTDGLPGLFLSYARADDEPFVRKLRTDLTARGYRVWFDKADMPNRGVQFPREIAIAIEESDRLLLVVGPVALGSVYVEAEWRHALAQCKPVHPLLRLSGPGNLPDELRRLDARMFQEDGRYAAELDRLCEQIGQPPLPLGEPLGQPPNLASHVLPRHGELHKLKEITLGNPEGPVALVGTRSALGAHGPGGRGKTTLAAMLARDCEIRRAFPDGILWLELNQDLTEAGILRLQEQLARMLHDPDPAPETQRQWRARLSTLLQNRRCLLILDNVWRAEHARALVADALGPGCRALITTRDAGVLTAMDAALMPLDVLNEREAILLLAQLSRQPAESLPNAAKQVADYCAGEPKALETLGATARGMDDPWEAILKRVLNPNPVGLRAKVPSEPLWRVLEPIDVSVDFLDPDMRARYMDFAVFPRGESIPESVLRTFWQPLGLDDFDIKRILKDLTDRTLLQHNAPGIYSLHDHNFDYLHAMAEDLPALNVRLLDAYAHTCPNGWPSGPNDGYFFQRLPWHLGQAGRDTERRALLFEFAWMHAKLKAIGVNALIADYDIYLATRQD